MYRIDNNSAVPNASGVPAPAVVGPKINGYFTGGNPGGGIPATIVDADWANAIQEEIGGVIEAGGFTLSKTDRTQLQQAIRAIAGKSIQVFNASGTFTVPAFVTKIKGRVAGAGAGGSGSNGTTVCGGGGGAGGYAEGIFTVTPGAVITITVGAGGAGGASGANSTAGGTSSIGALASATGGAATFTSGANGVGGGAPGVGSGGAVNLSGGSGNDGSASSAATGTGSGGASAFGGGGRAGSGSGIAGLSPGSGGGGAYSSAGSGAAGAAGIVIVEW